MDVPVSIRAIFVANKSFTTSLWNVSDFFFAEFITVITQKKIFRGAALDLVPLSFGYALSRYSRISLM